MRLIHSIHVAAGHRHRWRDAIAGLRGLLRGRAAVLARHDFASGRGEWLFESPSSPADSEAYAAEHSARNPWFISSLDYRPGRVMTGEELLASHALRRTDYYRDYLKPHGLLHRLCGVVSRRDNVVYYTDVLRGRGQPAFDDEDRALFGSILRHLAISFENHSRLVGARGENRALRAIVDRMDSAVFVVDVDATVLLANSSCEGLLEEFEGLEVRGERIAAASRAEGPGTARGNRRGRVGAHFGRSRSQDPDHHESPGAAPPRALDRARRRRRAGRAGGDPARGDAGGPEPPSHLRPEAFAPSRASSSLLRLRPASRAPSSPGTASPTPRGCCACRRTRFAATSSRFTRRRIRTARSSSCTSTPALCTEHV